jgi:hypothetical protein
MENEKEIANIQGLIDFWIIFKNRLYLGRSERLLGFYLERDPKFIFICQIPSNYSTLKFHENYPAPDFLI